VQQGAQVQPSAADNDGRSAVASRLGENGSKECQPAGDGRLLIGGEQAIEPVRDLRRFGGAWPGGENRQVREQLLAVRVDDEAVEPTCQRCGKGGLAARGAATYDDQRLYATPPEPPEPESRCRPSRA
jgi:hypothetical protein